jgi:histidine triad (HIT) family protein
MPTQSCIFCRIIRKELPAQIVLEEDDMIVIKDIAPRAPVHYLIIPKKHVADVASFEKEDEAIAGKMLLTAGKLSHGLSGSQAFRLIMNNGADAGQKVFHVHGHFLSGLKMLDF